ncbi:MAG: domain containing protein [Bacteroidetes bacterium]|nr:domain containing protein [Bacteroidota bacterium]
MKNIKYTFLSIVFLLFFIHQNGNAQNAPGGNVSSAGSFVTALGGNAYTSYQAGVQIIHVTKDIKLNAPINIIYGIYKLVPADSTCEIAPATSINRLFSIQTNANLTLQGFDGETPNETKQLKFEGKINDSEKCLQNIFQNSGTLIITSNVIIENHNGAQAAISNQGNIFIYGGIIQNNQSSENGGALFLNSGNATIDSVQFINNTALKGSAIYQNSYASLLLKQTNVNNGTIYLAENASISIIDQFQTNQIITLQKDNFTLCSPIISILTPLAPAQVEEIYSSFQFEQIPDPYVFEIANDSASIIINGICDTLFFRNCQQFYIPYTDSIYTSSTQFVHRIETNQTCDSLVKIMIEIEPYIDTIALTLCSYDFPYSIENGTIDTAGTYTYQYQAIDGCDSTLIYQVTMIPTIVDTQFVSVCDIELPYTFRDSVLITSGEYIFGSACNSFTHLFFQVNSSYNDTIWASICESALPYMFSNGQTYTVSGIYTNSYLTQSGCDSIVTLDLTVYPYFEATIAGDTLICENESTIFTASGSTQFLWSTGATTASIEPLQSGLYSVTVSDELNCYISSKQVHLTIQNTPQLVVTGEEPFCQFDSITLSCTGADFYIWNEVDTAVQKHIFNGNSLTIKALNTNGCFVLDTIEPIMYPAPILEIIGDQEICLGDSTTLQVPSGNSYLWSTGSTDTTIVVNPLITTTYFVTITSALQCSYVDSITVFVRPIPEIQILGDTIQCYGNLIQLTANGGDQYLWSNGTADATVALDQTAVVSVTVSNEFNCSAIKTIQVRIDTVPTLDISGNNEICMGQNGALTAQSDAPFVWSTNEITEHILVSPTINTTYFVTATNSYGCQTIDSFEVVVHELPIAQISGTDQFCSNTYTQLTATGGGSYLWNNGESGSSLVTNIGGTYTVTVTNQYGCSASVSKNISSLQAPDVTIFGDSVKCVGQSTQFSASGANTYQWNNGSTSPQITAINGGIYTVTGTSVNGCSATRSIEFIQSQPNIVISGDTSICVGETTILTASGGGTYLWSANNQTSASIFLSPVQTSFYYITVTNSLGCSAVKLVTLLVNPNPNVSIMGENSICQGDLTTLTANGGTSYAWSNGSNTASIYVSTAGFYTVTATSSLGCTSTAITSVNVKTKPNVSILGVPSFCQGLSTTLTATGGNNYVWSNGTSTQNNTINIPGTYSVTVTNSNNCTAVASIVVVMNEKPTASILGNRNFCANSQTSLTAMGGTNYLWNDGSSNQTITATTGGTYTVTVTNQNGCTSSVSAVTTVYSVPTPSISGSSEFCQGLSVNLIASGGVSYLWSSGATSTYINVNQTGTYIVTATDSRGCTAEATKTVIAHPLPVITITGDTNICTGGSSFLVANASGATSFVWSTAQTAPFINVSPSATTNYTVIVTNVNGCSNSSTLKVNVRPYPTPSIVGNNSFCDGDTLHLTAQGGASYLWNNSATNSSIDITNAGTYTVTVTSQYGCSSTISKTVTKNSLPIPVITGNGTICEGQNGTLTASGGVSYSWSNNVSTAIIHPSAAGTYTVTVTDANGCSSSVSTNITVNTPPNVSIIGDTSFCQGNSIILAASGTPNVSYLWSNSSTGTSISVNSSGIYSVTATHLNGCTANASKSITSLSLPNAQISGVLNPCLGKGTTLTASGGVSYIWSNGSQSNTINISPTVSSTYLVTVTGINGCTHQTSVVVNPLPVPGITITGGEPICQGEMATITASGGSSYQWSTGINSATINATVTGTYTVTVTNSMGCTATSSVPLLVNPTPSSEITGVSTLCEGTSTTLEATDGISYLWSNNATTPTISINPATSTSYSCTVTNNYGCHVVVNKPITVVALPTPQLFGGSQFCEGGSLTLSVAGGDSYLWNTNETGNEKIVTSPGLYSVTVTSNGCSASTYTYVSTLPLPTPTITDPVSICQGLSTTLTAGGGTDYHWSTGANNGSINTGVGGTYSVTVTNSDGCSATTSTTVTLLDIPNIQITGDSTICNGQSTQLMASGGISYLWNTSESNALLNVSPTTNTNYSVTVTNSAGCTSSKNILVQVFPVYQVDRVAQICQGQSYNGQGFTIPVQNSAGEFEFYNNFQTTQGCDSIIKLTLTVNPKPVITQAISGPSVINTTGMYSYIISNVQFADSYEWSINNPTWTLSNSTSNSVNLTVNNTGSGILTVYGVNECGVSNPGTLNILSSVAVETFDITDQITISPNPSPGIVIVENSSDILLTRYELYDLTGKMIKTETISSSKFEIDINNCSNGVYIIKLFEKNQFRYSGKVIKQ